MNKKLIDLIQNTLESSEYYQKVFRECAINTNDLSENEFAKIPVLTREQLFANHDRILHNAYHYVNRKELICARTSGSTGAFVEVLWNNSEYFASNMCLWRRRKEWYGISALDKMCTFFTDAIFNQKIILNKNIMAFSSIYMKEEDIANYFSHMEEFQPDWLMITPSIALIILQFCRSKSLSLPASIKYIELIGENVSHTVYNIILDYFKVPTSVMYGAKEVNGIALTCPHGKMHVLDDNVYVEVIEHNKLLVTCLTNTVFPIIRYDIGDVGELKKEDCNCGGGCLLISNLQGKDQYLSYIDKTSGITTILINHLLQNVDKIFDYPIIQCQIHYMGKNIVIHIFDKNEYKKWRSEIEKEFVKQFSMYHLADVKISFCFHDYPLAYDSKTGKLPLILKNEE